MEVSSQCIGQILRLVLEQAIQGMGGDLEAVGCRAFPAWFRSLSR
jgi:hypothetical protein